MGAPEQRLRRDLVHHHLRGARGHGADKLPSQRDQHCVCILSVTVPLGSFVCTRPPDRYARVSGDARAECVRELQEYALQPQHPLPFGVFVVHSGGVVPGSLAKQFHVYVLPGCSVLRGVPLAVRMHEHVRHGGVRCIVNMRILELQYSVSRIRIRM